MSMSLALGTSVVISGTEGELDNTLNYRFLLNSGTAITGATLKGPNLTFTRASDAGSFTSNGDFALVGGNDLPRFAHDPAASNAQLGLLMEEARTNSIFQSADFGTTWTSSNMSVSTNTTSGIFGTTTADTLTDDSTDSLHIVFSNTLAVTTNTDQASSIYARSGTDDFIFIDLQYSSNNHCSAVFDLDAGVIGETDTGGTSGTIVSHTIEDVGNGWFRCNFVGQAAGTSCIMVVGMCPAATGNTWDASGRVIYIGTGTTIIVEAAQLEIDKSFVSSHIPTTTVAVTRAKDVCTTTDRSWVNASNGMMFAQAIIPTVSGQERSLMTIDDGGPTDVMRLYLDAAENGNFETVNSGDTNGASDGAAVIAVDTVFKIAGTYEDDSVIGYVDGTASAEDTSAGIPVTDTATTLRIGDNSVTTEFNGYIQIVKFWNVTKNAAFAQAETT